MRIVTLNDDESQALTYLFRTLLEAPISKGGKTDGSRFFHADRDKGVCLIINEDEARILGSLITRIEANEYYKPTKTES
ncbi:hypothetical protein [Runella sp.]|uniref:hypothetical protein n=1 Tax=Runella sp. TaxID=1960881 RepID=UPI003D110724